MRNPDQSPLMELIRDYANLQFLDGNIVGMESAAAVTIEQSGELFANGNDQKATLMRSIGHEVRARAADMRRKEGEKRKKERERIYKEIIGHLERLVEKEQKREVVE